MNTYIIKAVDPTEYIEEHYRCVALLGTGFVRILSVDDPTLPGDQLAGGFDHDGNPVTYINQSLFNEMLPLGNYADGSATWLLRSGYVDGWAQEALGDPLGEHVARVYPADNQPFDLEIRHKLFEDPEHPQVNGWGFRVEMVGKASTRDPSARSTGAYEDETFDQALWPALGAFSFGQSDWQKDELGGPIDVWFQESWDGLRLDERTTWYIAVLHGPTIEGHAILPSDKDGIRYLFWEHVQGEAPSGDVWVDTGATVVAQAGTVYRISDAEVVSALITGQQIRFAESGDITTFTGTWAGGDDYIEIDPFVQAAVGDALWSFE